EACPSMRPARAPDFYVFMSGQRGAFSAMRRISAAPQSRPWCACRGGTGHSAHQERRRYRLRRRVIDVEPDQSQIKTVYYTPTFPGTNPWPYAIRSNLPLRQPRSSSSVPRRLAHSPISTEVKSTVALPGGRALTAPRTGRWLRQALRCLRLSAVRKHRPYRWSSLV